MPGCVFLFGFFFQGGVDLFTGAASKSLMSRTITPQVTQAFVLPSLPLVIYFLSCKAEVTDMETLLSSRAIGKWWPLTGLYVVVTHRKTYFQVGPSNVPFTYGIQHYCCWSTVTIKVKRNSESQKKKNSQASVVVNHGFIVHSKKVEEHHYPLLLLLQSCAIQLCWLESQKAMHDYMEVCLTVFSGACSY